MSRVTLLEHFIFYPTTNISNVKIRSEIIEIWVVHYINDGLGFRHDYIGNLEQCIISFCEILFYVNEVSNHMMALVSRYRFY